MVYIYSLLPRLASRPWWATDWWTKTQNMNTTYETKYLYCTACTTCTACTVSVLLVAHHGLLASLGNSVGYMSETLDTLKKVSRWCCHEASSWATELILMVCISNKLRSRPLYIIVKQKAK